MGPVGSFLIVAALWQAGTPDTATFADESTRALIELARVRHLAADSAVRDYQARLHYRVSFGVGRRQWSEPATLAVTEQTAAVAWALPNDLRVDILGTREAARLPDISMGSTFSRPWFVPRTLGDSIRIFGSTSPNRAATHPLSADGNATYRFAAGDSLVLDVAGRRTAIRSVAVTPRPGAPSAVVGQLWLDLRTGDVVRFTFRFVGTRLWAEQGDEMEEERASGLVARFLQVDADLEYSLHEQQYWLPYRQVVSGRVTVPFGVNVTVPFEAVSTFDDYRVNTGTPIVFDAPFRPDREKLSPDSARILRDSIRAERRTGQIPDSLRSRDRTGYLTGGGRFQIHRPPLDSLRRYDGWEDSLSLDPIDFDRERLREALREVAGMAEELDPSMIGRDWTGIAWDRLAAAFRYNRVQGIAPAMIGRTRAPFAFSELEGSLRFGTGDDRLMASIMLVRDAPSGRLSIAVARDLVDVDPFSRGLQLGNSLSAALAGRDDAGYLLAQGVRLRHESGLGRGSDLEWGVLVERQESVATAARAGLPRLFSGGWYFPGNASVHEGTAIGAHVQIYRSRYDHDLTLRGEVLSVGGEVAGRGVAAVNFDMVGGWARTRIRAGYAPGSSAVPQMAMMVGGRESIRGRDFAESFGEYGWSVQLDIARPGFGGARWGFFADAGQAASLGSAGAAPVLGAVGVGVSLVGGLIRADLSHPVGYNSRDHGIRLDLGFGRFR